MSGPPPLSSRARRIREIAGELAGCLGSVRSADGAVIAQRLCGSLERLGVTFVKLGQTLSTRRDLLPEPYTRAFSALTTSVEPMPYGEVQAQIELAFEQPISSLFMEFDREPLGSASLGQVHRARLFDGRDVAVKVQRVGAAGQVRSDLALLRALASGADGLGAGGDRLVFAELVESFAVATSLELDYRVEARNLRRVRAIMATVPEIHVPLPIRGLVRREVFVMELVPGTPLTHVELPENGEALARAVCDAYFEQILSEGFFHADPHPGNFLLDDQVGLSLIDLGMTEVLDDQDRLAIVQLVSGLAEGSTDRVVDAIRSLGTATDSADPEVLRVGVQHVVRRSVALRGVEPIFGETTYTLLREMMGSGYRPRPQLAVLARTLSMLDEVFERLDPQFDVASVVLERNALGMMAETSPRAALIPLARLVQRSPQQFVRLIDDIATGQFRVRVDAFDETAVLNSIQKIANRIAGAVIVAALLIAGSMLEDNGSGQVFGLSFQTLFFHGLGGLGALAILGSIFIFDRN